jgi:ketosteroid isomerase-like protein
MSNTDRFLSYLSAYARKDLAAVTEMFSDDVEVWDWNISVSGKRAALDETAKNFQNAKTIEIEALAIYAGADAVAGELKIVIDGEIELRVVDVVSFDTKGRIRAIRAYLGKS